MSEEQAAIATKTTAKQSSPRYPFIGLRRALERADALRQEAQHHAARVTDARRIWGYGPKSSGGDQTIAALSYYGLLEDAGGTGEARRVKLTDAALRYFRDERPEVRTELEQRFVMQPKAMQALWALWKREPPSSNIARSILRNDLKYSDFAADELLTIYADNLQFLPATTSVISQKPPAASRGNGGGTLDSFEQPPPSVSVGDYVQWTSQGQDQFSAPKRVERVSDDGKFAFVLGSRGGLPMIDLTVTDPPGVKTPEKQPKADPSDDNNQIEVFVAADGRLQISASVDAEGLEKLKRQLEKYTEILKLI